MIVFFVYTDSSGVNSLNLNIVCISCMLNIKVQHQQLLVTKLENLD